MRYLFHLSHVRHWCRSSSAVRSSAVTPKPVMTPKVSRHCSNVDWSSLERLGRGELLSAESGIWKTASSLAPTTRKLDARSREPRRLPSRYDLHSPDARPVRRLLSAAALLQNPPAQCTESVFVIHNSDTHTLQGTRGEKVPCKLICTV